MSRHTTVTVEVDVDVDFSELDTDDLMEELERRGRNPSNAPMDDYEAKARLEAIYHHMRMRQSKVAYKLMYDYVRDVLGKAV